MATMASTSHGLTTWANACVKNPINPKTGLSATLPERSRISVRFGDVSDDFESSYIPNGTAPTGDGRDWFRESLEGKDVNSRLQAATAQEFYEKLQLLKEENKKTLEAYGQIYQEKLLLEGIKSGGSYVFKPDKSGADREIENSVLGLNENIVKKNETVTKKPPPGKPIISSSGAPILSQTVSHRSDPSAKLERSNLVRSRSLDDTDFRLNGLTTSMGSDDFVILNGEKTDYEKALEKVDKLWDDFKISEYTQKRRNSLTSNGKNKENTEKVKEWRHRITVPEPFTMSVRDALKVKKKTRAQSELEQRRLEKEQLEEEECAKKFKAQPAPSHIYLPLYSEITERNESRRKYVKSYCKDLLQSQVKPFNFEVREKEKKNQRAMSAPIKRPETPKKNNFKAKPVPKSIFDPSVDEKLMEDEELRKIRVKMRAKELLRESSLPPNMAEREKLKQQQKKEALKKAKKNGLKKQRPRSAHVVPDYDILYREFQKELARRKMFREGTVVEPFDLDTARMRKSTQEKIRRDIDEDDRRLKEDRWPFTGSRTTPRSSLKYLGALSTSLDSIPTSLTKSAHLRSSVVQKEKERVKMTQREEEEADRKRKAREARLRRYLNEKTNSQEIPLPRESVATRLKRMKQDDRARQEAYQREIEEMRARVEQAPLLVEKFMADNAKREAEKKFSSTVRNAGFNDTEFTSGQRSLESLYNDEEFDTGTADMTYTKGTDEDYEDEQYAS